MHLSIHPKHPALRIPSPILVLAASLLASCATIASDPGVEVSIVNIAFENATVLETTARFTVRVQNENPEPLLLEGAVHKIYLNGAYIGKGMSNETLEVDRLATATQSVTVHLRNLRFAGKLQAIMRSKEASYHIESTLHTRSDGFPRRINLANEGSVDLSSRSVPELR